MFRYRLRTLLALLMLGPPLLAGAWWVRQRLVERKRQADFEKLLELIQASVAPFPWEDVGGPGMVEPFEGRCCVCEFVEDAPIFDERESIRFEFRDGMVWVFEGRPTAGR